MFSDRLKIARETKGISQAELARRIGVSRDLYNKYEKAGVSPSPKTLTLISKELGVTTDHLLLDNVPNTASPATIKKTTIKDEDLKFALWGRTDVDDKALDDVKRFARFMEMEDKEAE